MVLYEGHSKLLQIKKYIRQYPEIFYKLVPQDWKQNRDLTDKQFEKILEGGLVTIKDFENENIFVLGEYLHYLNPSLAIKMGVNIVLFGGSLHFLGTESHRHILEQLVQGTIKGCFAMTEIGHGSNLRNLNTIAKKVGDKLIIDSMVAEGVKCWIGGSTTADYTTVFCQLYDENNVHQGLHAVLVPLKSYVVGEKTMDRSILYPGVTIQDMGSKLGLNGIDNGYIKFSNVEVPITNLLNRYGGFNEKGDYFSTIKNKNVRFGLMLSALSMGRISIAMGSYSIAYKSFIIALKYNLQRRQFIFRGKQEEKRIIEYYSQLKKFCIIYSSLYYIKLGILDLIELYKKEGFSKKVHAISSFMKVYSSWMSVKISGWCREMCGGHGYLWDNQIGQLMNDVNVYQTFEGDNSVLIQQGVKWLLDEFNKNKLVGIMRYVKSYTILGNKVEKIKNRFNKDLGELVFKFGSKNKEQIWLNNLNNIIRIGLDYTKLHLLYLTPNNENKLLMNIYSSYVLNNEINKDLMNMILKNRVLEGVVDEWDKTMIEVSDYIPITKYPEYLSRL